MTDSDNSVGGRLTLGVGGIAVLAIGVSGLGIEVTYPSIRGLGTYGLSGLLVLCGGALLVAAIVNPYSLDIGKHEGLDKAELQERRTDDEL